MNLIQLQAIDEFSISTRPVARCADGNGTLTPLFFSDHVLDIARAKAICAKCALREQCLADALEREEPWGVWGGELLSGGRIVFNKRPGGRPPKRPRPPVIVNELGVVDTEDSVLADLDFDELRTRPRSRLRTDRRLIILPSSDCVRIRRPRSPLARRAPGRRRVPTLLTRRCATACRRA